MASTEQLALLKQGVDVWNQQRLVLWNKFNKQQLWEEPNWLASEEGKLLFPDLRGVNLSETSLENVDLREINLFKASFRNSNLFQSRLAGATLDESDFSGASLEQADLSFADLCGANLSGVNLVAADLTGADLTGADLTGADLDSATFNITKLSGTKFNSANLSGTIFAGVDLSSSQGLEDCRHSSYSHVDHQTLLNNSQLPLSFLRGVGLPDTLIDYMPSLLNKPIQFYSCFISYSHKDEEFAKRLHADLQDKGVRCWYAPEDLPIGAKIRAGIDQAIRRHDKLLLILSEQSVNSPWVESEVESALEKEQESGCLVLFPVRIDDAVMDSSDGWAGLIKRSRNIGNFCNWKNYDVYQSVFDRLVKDLKRSLSETS